MRRRSSLLGLIGLVLLLFAGVAAALTRGRTSVDVIYIAANGLLGLFALIAYLSAGFEQVREAVSDRSSRYGTNVIIGSLAFVGVLVLLNYMATRYDRRFDLTEQGVFSLSPQSRSVVEGLQQDLTVQAFVEGGISPDLADLLGLYAHHSPRFQYELIDPDKHPELAERYQIRQYNTVRFQYGNESTTITQPTEENITNAIIRVTRTARKTICFIEGHGEPDIEDVQSPRGLASLKQALTNENYEVKKVLLAAEEKVPEDCTAIVVAGPEKPYLDVELQRVSAYLKSGGRALILLPPRQGLEWQPLLAELGVTLGSDVVVDQVIRLFQGPALGLTPLVNTYGVHEITREFKQRTIFPMTRSVRAAGGKPGVQATELAKTSPQSWAETDLDGIFARGEASLDSGADTKGPVSVAVAVEIDLKQLAGHEGTARLAVYGSAEMAGNRELEGTYYNRDLMMNTVGWLVGQSDLVSIRPRGIRASRAQLTPEQHTVILYLSVLVLPQLLLIAGIVAWWRRE
jgi:ABC-type uncharacterized transport system involved in gliding motility auxiliary subunit